RHIRPISGCYIRGLRPTDQKAISLDQKAISLLGRIHQLDHQVWMQFSPDTEVGLQLHPQVGLVDEPSLLRRSFDGAIPSDLSATAAPPEVIQEVTCRSGVGKENSHFSAVRRGPNRRRKHGCTAA